MKKENDVLEATLSLAGRGYPVAYDYLRNVYSKNPQDYGPQTFYFLACLAGGSGRPEEALEWLRTAICSKGWWYRPEVLEDEDLAALKNLSAFQSLKSISDDRYASAASQASTQLSWEKKEAERLFLAIHGNTQNAQTARADWEPIVGTGGSWQIETVQSAEPDGYGTYRWRYDETSYLPVAHALKQVEHAGYRKIACGGFSAGCDMLLRAVTFTPARCDLLLLQSPWIPLLHKQAQALVHAISQKKIAVRIFCGAEDADCLPMARQLSALLQAERNGTLTVQASCRHQFPAEGYHLEEGEIL